MVIMDKLLQETIKGTFRFLETKTKTVFKDKEKVRLHTEAFLEF